MEICITNIQRKGHESEGKTAKNLILPKSDAKAYDTLKVNVYYFRFIYAVHVPWNPARVAVSYSYALTYKRQTLL